MRLLFVGIIAALSSCSEREEIVLHELDSAATHVTFANQLTESEEHSIIDNEYIYNGGGVAVADFNNDDLPDLFFTGNTVSSRLYINRGSFEFKDVTELAGVSTNRWATGVSVVDINSDGWMDLYVTCAGSPITENRRNYLFVNEKDGTFSESAAAYGIDDTSYSTHSTFFDYDRDGDLDLYLLNHSNNDRNPNVILPQKRDGSGKSTDKLYRNDGGRFTDVSAKAGILVEGYGLGVAITDVNNDGWPDIYVTNDYVYNDILYINQRDGTFTDELKRYVGHTSLFSMGVDAADVNNDLAPDILSVDMLPPDNFREKLLAGPMAFDRYDLLHRQGYVPQVMRNTLQVNNGDSSFREVGQFAGIEATDWSWSALLADLDNDGWKDVFVTNGYLKNITDRDFQMYSSSYFTAQFSSKNSDAKRLRSLLDTLSGAQVPNAIFINNKDLTFRKATEDVGLTQWNVSHGAAYADLDIDGDLDLVVNNQNSPASIIENRWTANGFLQVKLIGDSLNPFAIGAKITLKAKSGSQVVEHYTSRGYQSSMCDIIHFGLGEVDSVDHVSVLWPDGSSSSISNVKANQRITIKKNSSAGDSFVHQQDDIKKMFVRLSPARLGVYYKHLASEYIDYKSEPLIPYQFSKVPPALAVADVNSDELDDFYIGGSSRSRGQLFIQQKSGGFVGSVLDQSGMVSIETDAKFFDYDSDGDKDLIIVSGGNEYYPSSVQYMSKVYRNVGDGNFTLDGHALPPLTDSYSVVEVGDFNNDSKLDLFFGGMIEPLKYPLPPDSRILFNMGGKFIDVTSAVCPSLLRHGLIKAAKVVDLDRNGLDDLVISGEYLPVEVFLNTGKEMINSTKQFGLSGRTGWWRSLLVDDVDSDGDFDIIAGNFGVNTRLRASADEPLTVVVNDFDNNGSFDAITGRYSAGTLVPVASRDMVLEQVPGFKKRFINHRSFGRATLAQCVGEEAFEKSFKFTASEMRHILFRNSGDTFVAEPLPLETQVAPVSSILKVPGRTEYIISGNDYSPDPTQGPLDALEGKVIRPSGKELTLLKRSETGLRMTGHNGKSQWIKVKSDWILMTPVLNDSIAFHCLSGN